MFARRADVVNGKDIGMRELRHRLRFPERAPAQIHSHCIGRSLWPEYLEGNLAIELRVARGIDDAHSARADRTNHFVAPDAPLLENGDLGRRLPHDFCKQLPAEITLAQMALGLRQHIRCQAPPDIAKQFIFRDASHGFHPRSPRTRLGV